MKAHVSIFDTLMLLQQFSKAHWEQLQKNIDMYSKGVQVESDQQLIFKTLELDLQSVITKFRNYVDGGQVELARLTDREWRSIELAYTVHLNHLESVMKNMRLHSVSPDILINVEKNLSDMYSKTNSVKLFFMNNCV